MESYKLLSVEIQLISGKAEKEFGSLNAIQLNWKPATEQWSIGQCIEHMIVSNSKYVPILKNIVSGKNKTSLWEKINPLSNYTGGQMIRTLGRVVKKKYKSPLLFMPSKSNISQNVIPEFIKHQQEIKQLFSVLENDKYKSIVITSPVAALITMPLYDLLNLIVVHEERHIEQAMRLKNNMAFPS